MEKVFEAFIDRLALAKVTANVYNQYSYGHEENSIRRDNLLIYLKQMYEIRPEILLVGEAPGYRGCRLTGVPFTSEHLLMNNVEGLDQFGRENGYRLALEKEHLMKEATATIIWNTLLQYKVESLGWNAFPFHPHKEGKPDSNRTPLKKELLIGQDFLLQMIKMFSIKKVVAVGNKAEESLRKLGINCEKVRHPAQGGKNDFVRGIGELKGQ
ncbi:MAG: uracil-DNA glycosylase [Tissierellaceae bacterium]